MTVIDADGHIVETDEQLFRHLEEPYRRRDRVRPLYPADGWDRRLGNTLGSRASDAQSWLKALDEGGMDSTVLYPTSGLFIGFLKDQDWAVAISRAYNNFIAEEVLRVSPRIKAVALLPVQAPQEAAAEVGRALTQLGFVGGGSAGG